MVRVERDPDRRAKLARQWICPDCGGKLVKIPAKLVHPAHGENEWGRGCSDCLYSAYLGEDNKNVEPKSI